MLIILKMTIPRQVGPTVTSSIKQTCNGKNRRRLIVFPFLHPKSGTVCCMASTQHLPLQYSVDSLKTRLLHITGLLIVICQACCENRQFTI